jgi:hypothetical protein
MSRAVGRAERGRVVVSTVMEAGLRCRVTEARARERRMVRHEWFMLEHWRFLSTRRPKRRYLHNVSEHAITR